MYRCNDDIISLIPPLWKWKAGCVDPSFNLKITYGQPSFAGDIRNE